MRTSKDILRDAIEGAATAYFVADVDSDTEAQAQALLDLLWDQYDDSDD